jgi:hypothetical protein
MMVMMMVVVMVMTVPSRLDPDSNAGAVMMMVVMPDHHLRGLNGAGFRQPGIACGSSGPLAGAAWAVVTALKAAAAPKSPANFLSMFPPQDKFRPSLSATRQQVAPSA